MTEPQKHIKEKIVISTSMCPLNHVIVGVLGTYDRGPYEIGEYSHKVVFTVLTAVSVLHRRCIDVVWKENQKHERPQLPASIDELRRREHLHEFWRSHGDPYDEIEPVFVVDCGKNSELATASEIDATFGEFFWSDVRQESGFPSKDDRLKTIERLKSLVAGSMNPQTGLRLRGTASGDVRRVRNNQNGTASCELIK